MAYRIRSPVNGARSKPSPSPLQRASYRVAHCFSIGQAATIALLLTLPASAAPKKHPPVVQPAAPAHKPLDVILPVAAPPAAWLSALPEAQRPPKDAKLSAALPIGPLAPITSTRFSPDGRWLLAASDGRVVVWDARTGDLVAELPGIAGMVHTIAFSPDGKWLAVGGGTPTVEGRVALFGAGDLSKPPVAVLTGHHDVVYRLAFSADGKLLATASLDRTAEVWDLASRKPIATLTGHSDALDAVAFTPDGRGVLTGSMDHAARLWNVHTAKSERAFSGAQSGILALELAPDGKRIVTADQDGDLRWWNLADAKPVRTSGGHRGEVGDVVFSRDGKQMASAGADGTARLWDGATGASRITLSASAEPLYAVDFSPDGHLVAAGGWDGILRIWETAKGASRLALVAAPQGSGFRVQGSDRTPTRRRTGARSPILNPEPRTLNPGAPAWLAITPAGYYDGAAEMVRRLQWRIGTMPAPQPAALSTALRKREQVAAAFAK